ncbi:cytochrome [Sphingomonas sp. Root710]|uniref:cytochrome P450 n=1 Tax=Sphingomonas sp. Root710 TaxID=1736594 RepID=UPI0006F481D2|nr:cytochrome P450 [Sphingomonas sp. Root710]KRB82225.1 cytochrome [Sphingomonas sp. Root710]
MTTAVEIQPFDPSLPELITDPYPIFAEIRENDRFHWSKFGYWVVSRYDDVREVLMNRKDFGTGDFANNLKLFYGPDFDVMANSAYRWLSEVFIAKDPPQHTRIRGLVTGSLTAKRVRAMEPRIREICRELTDAFIADGQADMMTQFAYQLPVMVICDLMGIDYRHPDMAQLTAGIPEAFVVFEARRLTDRELSTANRRIDELEAFFRAQFEDRLANPRDDLLTALAQTGTAPDGLTMHEATTVAIALFGAGFETTANIIGNGLYRLHRHHDQWERLVADPAGLAGSTNEEVLRFESSLVAAYRTALNDTEIAGHPVKAGQRVLTLVGAANRDGRKFDDPDRFDIGRGAADHMSFGGGIHFCVGAELARIEGRIAFEHLATVLPDMQIDLDSGVWRDNFLFRGLTRLDARW